LAGALCRRPVAVGGVAVAVGAGGSGGNDRHGRNAEIARSGSRRARPEIPAGGAPPRRQHPHRERASGPSGWTSGGV
jgi:hypothetical protein